MPKFEQKLLILSFGKKLLKFLQSALCVYLQIALCQKQKFTSRPLIGTVKLGMTQTKTEISVETPKRLPELEKK